VNYIIILIYLNKSKIIYIQYFNIFYLFDEAQNFFLMYIDKDTIYRLKTLQKFIISYDKKVKGIIL